MSKRLEKKKDLQTLRLKRSVRTFLFLVLLIESCLVYFVGLRQGSLQSANMHEKLLPKKQSLEKEAELLPIIAEFLAFDPK